MVRTGCHSNLETDPIAHPRSSLYHDRGYKGRLFEFSGPVVELVVSAVAAVVGGSYISDRLNTAIGEKGSSLICLFFRVM